jgi:hypothetical protein
MKKQASRWGSLALLAAVLCGCRSFDSAWNEARQGSAAGSGIEGRWVGSWQNTNINSHTGQLRAVLVKRSDTNYTARFHATWGSHSGSFKTMLNGTNDGDDFVFESRKRILGFLIVTHGRANPTNFVSTYESRFDNGTFTMRRPAGTE